MVHKDLNEEVKSIEELAEGGDDEYQHKLGNCYYYGKYGLKQDYAKAVKWFRKAAEQKHTGAQFKLGKCYEVGKGVRQNFNEARKWFRKAAKEGHAEAQFKLGKCYDVGQGVKQNFKTAVKWYFKAARQGHIEAQDELGNWYVNDEGAALKEEVNNWLHKVTEHENKFDQFYLEERYSKTKEKTDEERKRRAEEEQKLKAEEEQKRRAEEEQKLKAEEERKRNTKEYIKFLTEEKGHQEEGLYSIPDLGMKLVYVAPGSFQMGSDCGYLKAETLVQGYWIGKYEVTQSEYQAIMGTNPSGNKSPNNPVEFVSWDDAVDFCENLTKREHATKRLPDNCKYRLPTETEWEFAARGGNKSRGYKYSGSNDINTVAWYYENSGDEPHEVGTKSDNELGIYDMSGNVEELCLDYYDICEPRIYGGEPVLRGWEPTARGGYYRSAARHCDPAHSVKRPCWKATFRGFRIVKTVP